MHNAKVFAQLRRSDKDVLALRRAVEKIAAGHAALLRRPPTPASSRRAADLATGALDAMSCVAGCDGATAGARAAPPSDRQRPHHADRHGPRDRLVGALRRESARADPHAGPRRRRGPGRAPRSRRRHGRRGDRERASKVTRGLGRPAGPRRRPAILGPCPRPLLPSSSSSTPRPPVSTRTATASSTSAPCASARTSKSATASTTLVDPGDADPALHHAAGGHHRRGRARRPRPSARPSTGLREFAGDAVLAGHNVDFDRDHLAAGRPQGGPAAARQRVVRHARGGPAAVPGARPPRAGHHGRGARHRASGAARARRGCRDGGRRAQAPRPRRPASAPRSVRC